MTHANTHKHTQTHTNTHKHTQTHTNTHKHTQTHKHTTSPIHGHNRSPALTSRTPSPETFTTCLAWTSPAASRTTRPSLGGESEEEEWRRGGGPWGRRGRVCCGCLLIGAPPPPLKRQLFGSLSFTLRKTPPASPSLFPLHRDDWADLDALAAKVKVRRGKREEGLQGEEAPRFRWRQRAVA